MNIEFLSSKGQRSRSQQHRAPFYQQTSQNSLTDCRMNLKLVGNIRGMLRMYTFKHYNIVHLSAFPRNPHGIRHLRKYQKEASFYSQLWIFVSQHCTGLQFQSVTCMFSDRVPVPTPRLIARLAAPLLKKFWLWRTIWTNFNTCRRKMFFDSFTSPCKPYAPSTAGATGPYNSALVSVYRYANLFHTSRRCNMRNCW